MEATVDYRLITASDVIAAPYSTSPVDGQELRDRVVFARTRGGKYAKFQAALVGDNLQVSRLTLYDRSGFIERFTAAPFVVRTAYGCDLEGATEVAPGPNEDFFWEGISSGVQKLWCSTTGVALGIDFERLPWPGVLYSTHWSSDPVEAAHLEHQIVYLAVPRRRIWAKALVEPTATGLLFKRLVVWTVRGGRVLDVSNVTIGGRRGWGYLLLRTGTTTWFLGNADFACGPGGITPMNGSIVSYPSYYRFAKYLPQLAAPATRAAMQFARPGHSAPNLGYDYWEEELRRQLDEDLYLLETARPLPQAGPPPVTYYAPADSQYIGLEDARNLYLAHVAQCLWVEATGAVAWPLPQTQAGLEQLLASELLMSEHATQYEFRVMGRVTAWNPQAAFAFLHANGLIGPDAFSTVKNFADWCRRNLTHITDFASDPNGPFATPWDQFQWYYGYSGYPPVERVLQPPPGKPHITAGCWGTSGLLAGVLRSVNIPVRHGRTNFSGAIHSRPEFLSIGQNLAHGDDPYNRLVGVGHHTPPIDVIFYTDADLAAEIDNPSPLPGKTVPETTSANALRRHGDVAIQYKTDYLLGMRCYDLQHGVPNPTVTGSQLWQEMHDAYSNTELTQIAAVCDTEIAALGGCSQIPPI